ncbi:CHAT domain-containing protein [Nonomuraea sp. NEAU-A123]|uniref:CHAT domain-containing protein n=1 Tax=Nonomuraea sp. NEAU-A123 TaxID=2839649 RepID=UPI001BE4911F|nr:CHAT domain-containing protein [Nonomuraea sp. NEAU-A123]MBT2229869.1 CHAT domain-containing protein [Nonomuraea sp. NEAU-A123]
MSKVTADGSEIYERVARLHGLAVAATDDGHPGLAARRLRQGLALLRWETGAPPETGDPERAALLARLLTSLAHAEAEQGHSARGTELLDEAQRWAPPAELAIVQGQRGLMYLRTGRTAEALELLDLAVPRLARGVELARVLLNRSVIHLMTGKVGLARADARRSAELARAQGHEVIEAKAQHNDGYCDLLLGDIPTALAVFGEVERAYRRVNPGFLPVLALDQARALLAAGLADEAGRTLDGALDGFRKQRLMQDYAEAELARAQAALHAGRFAEARAWARRAENRFRRRRSPAWALRAELMRLRADLAGPARPGSRGAPDQIARPGAVARKAGDLAARCAELGLRDESEMAALLATRALVAAGNFAEAEALWSRAEPVVARPGSGDAPLEVRLGSGSRAAPLEVRLMRRLAEAELASARGLRGQALRRVRSGLALIHAHRGRLGSLDMQTGVTALGSDLAAAGLAAALANGSARLVFEWSERCRAQAFRFPPIRPQHDEPTAEALAELRHLAQQLHAGEAAARRDPEIRRRCLELERLIRERGWQLPGARESLAPASTGVVEAELAAAGLALVSLLNVRGRLLALVLGAGRCRLLELGAYAPLAEAVQRLTGDLNARAGRNLRPNLAAVIDASLRRQLATIADGLLTPLLPSLAEAHGIVVVPTMALSAIPWGTLPGLVGKPVVAAPSAQVWAAAQRARLSSVADGEPPLLVAGPNLTAVEPEIEQIAALYPKAQQLTGSAATVAATLEALDGASIAHLAAHGHHERENVLFSRLILSDGPLMAHDVQRLRTAPRHVVLSACDIGRLVVRPGDELLGFTAALLYMGTPTVVSSVAKVPDETAIAVMAAYHRQLALGLSPAAALAAASASVGESSSTFVCFGAG